MNWDRSVWEGKELPFRPQNSYVIHCSDEVIATAPFSSKIGLINII